MAWWRLPPLPRSSISMLLGERWAGMNNGGITRVLELLGALIPGPFELTLFVPLLFGLYTAARAIGIDADWVTEAGVAVAVIFSWLVWMTFSVFAGGSREGSAAAASRAPESKESSRSIQCAEHQGPRQTLERVTESQPKDALDPVHSVERPSEAARQARVFPVSLR